MRPENYEVRGRLLRRFILLYLVSIGLVIAGFRGLSGREEAAGAVPGANRSAAAPPATANPANASPGASGTGGRSPAGNVLAAAGNVPAVATEGQRANQLMAELDSVRRQVLLLRREVLIKDSLIDQLAMAPVPEIYDHAFEKQEMKQRQKEKAVIRDALQKIGHAG